MAVDEFGREIPAGGSGSALGSSGDGAALAGGGRLSSRSRSRDRHPDGDDHDDDDHHDHWRSAPPPPSAAGGGMGGGVGIGIGGGVGGVGGGIGSGADGHYGPAADQGLGGAGAGAGAGGGSSQRSRGRSDRHSDRYDRHDSRYGRGSGGREGREGREGRHSRHSSGGGGRYGRNGRGRSRSPPSGRRDGGGHYGPPSGPSSRRSSRGGRSGRDGRDGKDGRGGRDRHRNEGGPHGNVRNLHPSERYVDGPLLCEYLWAEEAKYKGSRVSGDGGDGGDGGGGKRMDIYGKLGGAATHKMSEESKKEFEDAAREMEDELMKEEEEIKDQQNEGEKALQEQEQEHPGLMDEAATGGAEEAEAKDADAKDAAPDSTAAENTTDGADEGTEPSEENKDDNQTTTKDVNETKTKTDADNSGQTYPSYVSSYCLSYVRTFFNDHLDDGWFRRRYSPLERRRAAQAERDRKATEAKLMMARAEDSVQRDRVAKEKAEKAGSGNGNGKEGANANANGEEESKDKEAPSPSPCDFVLEARLSGGTKPGLGTTAIAGDGSSGGMDAALSAPRDGPGERESSKRTATSTAGSSSNGDGGASATATATAIPSNVPRSHLHASVATNRVVRVVDVPSHVTDRQLVDALVDHAVAEGTGRKGKSGGILEVHSTTVGEDSSGLLGTGGGGGSGSGSGSSDFLDRTCFVVMESEQARETLLDNLKKANEDAHRHRHRDSGRGSAFLELDVDCTDPYGRYDIDADGKGKGPANADEFGPDDEDNPGKLPVRRATVFVATAPQASDQPVSVLSAAVSSSGRIGRDGVQAITIARALDVAAAIPRGMRLDDLLELVFPAGTGALERASMGSDQQQEAEDILDVTIAYLRRVHLFSFYNGCTSADGLADALASRHPAGTIHLRLAGADEILKKALEEAEAPFEGMSDAGETAQDGTASTSPVSKDLLVMRLDESISKALEEVTSSIIASSTDDCPVDEKTNAVAKEIEAAEEAVAPTWIDSHALVDDDGRARCSFHFCRKLFKDRKFLEKHLVKKHSEHLRAEQAKCHDAYMMKCWDAEECRPVPPILVDCGSRFGMVPSAVRGADNPMADDPEPELWAKEEQRRAKIEEEQRKHRERRAAADAAAEEDGGVGMKRPRAAANFEDVDDMKDEKVELSFEADVPQPKKKKKKKRKSLL